MSHLVLDRRRHVPCRHHLRHLRHDSKLEAVVRGSKQTNAIGVLCREVLSASQSFHRTDSGRDVSGIRKDEIC